jgi:YaiO family outer membrane protein
MNRPLFFSLLVLMMLHAAHAVAQDSHLADAELAIQNKNFTQAETILSDYLQHAEKDSEARFLLARVFSWQNKWTQALEQFDKLLQEKPDSSDLLLARANTLEWMGLRRQALYDLARAREISPDYSDIWRTEIIILQRDNTPTSRSKAYALINKAKNKFPEKNWDELLLSENKVLIERDSYAAEFIYGYDKLTNNRSPWSTRSVKLNRITPDKHYANVQLDNIERFDLQDWQLGGSYALPFLQSWSVYLAATYSPTHKVLANRMLDTNLSKSFKNGTTLSAGLSNARYSETSSQQVHLAGEYYWSEFRLAYTYRHINVLNAGTGVNHNIQGNYYYSPVDMLGVSVATGKDVEFDGTANPPISDVRTYSIYGYHMFKPRWSLIYSLFNHHQGDFYNRNGFVLGIKFDF